LFGCLFASACTGKYYSADDYGKVLKIDAHIHVDADDGVLERLAAEDNFYPSYPECGSQRFSIPGGAVQPFCSFPKKIIREGSFTVQLSGSIQQDSGLKHGYVTVCLNWKGTCRKAQFALRYGRI
jgi:hypothetical protein